MFFSRTSPFLITQHARRSLTQQNYERSLILPRTACWLVYERWRKMLFVKNSLKSISQENRFSDADGIFAIVFKIYDTRLGY